MFAVLCLDHWRVNLKNEFLVKIVSGMGAEIRSAPPPKVSQSYIVRSSVRTLSCKLSRNWDKDIDFETLFRVSEVAQRFESYSRKPKIGWHFPRFAQRSKVPPISGECHRNEKKKGPRVTRICRWLVLPL